MKFIVFFLVIVLVFAQQRRTKFKGTYSELSGLKKILNKLENRLLRDAKSAKVYIKNASEEKKLFNSQIKQIESIVVSKYKSIEHINKELKILHEIRKLVGVQHVGKHTQAKIKKKYFHNLESGDQYSGSKILRNGAMRDRLRSIVKMGSAKWKLIYRGSRDGFDSRDFHRKCNGKGPTLSVIRTTGGNIIGGYNSNSWSSSGGYQSSSNNFVFNYNKGWKMPIKTKSYGVYRNAGYGPTFGAGHDLYIYSTPKKSNSNYVSTHSYNYSGGKYLLGRYGKTTRFTVSEIEVFQK